MEKVGQRGGRGLLIGLAALWISACGNGAEPPKGGDSGTDGGLSDTGTSTATDGGIETDGGADAGFPDGGGGIIDLCDPLAQSGCSAPTTKCIIETGGGQCIEPSASDVGLGTSCMGGRCEAGLVCVGTGTGTTAVCRKVCDRQTGEGCTNLGFDADCLESVRGTNWGVCTALPPVCDPVTQDPCGAGEACQTLLRFDGSFELRCRPAGPGQAGDNCQNQRCDRGLICVNVNNEPTCKTICADDNGCAGSCNGSVNGVDVKYCTP